MSCFSANSPQYDAQILTLSQHCELCWCRRFPQGIVGDARVDPCIRDVEALNLKPGRHSVALGTASSLKKDGMKPQEMLKIHLKVRNNMYKTFDSSMGGTRKQFNNIIWLCYDHYWYTSTNINSLFYYQQTCGTHSGTVLLLGSWAFSQCMFTMNDDTRGHCCVGVQKESLFMLLSLFLLSRSPLLGSDCCFPIFWIAIIVFLLNDCLAL